MARQTVLAQLQAQVERLRGDPASILAVVRLLTKALVLLHEAHQRP
jgi:hypothetical protein